MRRYLISVLALVAGAALGVVLWTRLADEPAAAEPPRIASSDQVALNVRHDGRALRLNWDRNAPAIRDATHAILHIDDGNHRSEMNLDPQSLASGTASYWPESREVRFRLEVFAPGRVTSGSIQAPGVAAETKPSPFVTPAPPKRHPKIVALNRPEPEPEPVVAPPKPSKVSRFFGKIPLLRRLKKNPQSDDK